MHHQLRADHHYGHPALLCCGSYGNLKEHQMFYLKCEGIICVTVRRQKTVEINTSSPAVGMIYSLRIDPPKFENIHVLAFTLRNMDIILV